MINFIKVTRKFGDRLQMMETWRKLDDVDKTIIKALLRNARTSFSDIASQCGLSALTIKNHYNRLRKEGVIKGSTVILNLLAFGNDSYAIFLVKVPNDDVNCMKRSCLKFSQIDKMFLRT